MADLFGPPPLDQWPAHLPELIEERIWIKMADLDPYALHVARVRAFAETWEMWLNY